MLKLQYLLELHSIFLGIVAVLFFVCFQKKLNTESKIISIVIMVNNFVLFWDIMAYGQQGVVSEYGFIMHVVANFFLYALEYLEVTLLAEYIYRVLWKYTGIKYQNMPRIAIILNVILLGFLIANLFTGCYYYFDEQNFYHRGPLFIFNILPQFLLMWACFWIVIRKRKQIPTRLLHTLLFFFVAPSIGIFLQVVFFGFSFFNVATSVSILAFFWFQVLQLNEDNRKREEILFQTQTCLLSAQMNPHFMFNALNVIGCLMDEDIDQAHEALLGFSNYLRRSLEIDPEVGLVSLENELEFAKEYIRIEKLRFGDMIDVQFDLKDLTVRLPYLTIEPLVENAIKHGIRKRPGKGTVLVKTWKEGGTHVIIVRDDGVGFDPNLVEKTGERSKIGLNNVRERIRILCNGTLTINSKIGSGTTIELRIPEVSV